MRRTVPFLLLLATLPLAAHSADLAGTWQYEKGAEYFGQLKTLPAPAHPTLQISNGLLTLSPRCMVALKPQSYNYGDVFQGLLKEDVTEAALTQYLNQSFTFPLAGTKTYYQADSQPGDCNKPLRSFIVKDNKLLVPFAGSAFYSFVRSDGQTSKSAGAPQLYGRKASHLPFSTSGYIGACLATLPKIKGVPQSTDKCGPVYLPYVATANGDALAKLIGSHDYQQGGARHAEDYNNPFAQQLHPTFTLLPPWKEVLLVRVDDLEPGIVEKRDTMSGVFLVIKNGKVTDQLNQGCLITTDYACVDEDGKHQYQLLESGKFQKLN